MGLKAVVTPNASQISGLLKPTASNTFAFVGDSRIAQMFSDNTGIYPGAVVKSNHFFHVANALLGQRMKISYAGGISGDRSDQYLVNLPTALATKPSWLMIWSVVNDISQSGTTGDTALTIFNRIKNAATTALNSGTNVILLTEPGSTALTTSTLIGMVNQFNEYIREYAAITPGIFLFDIASVSIAPSSTTIAFISGYSTDGLHLNGYGSWYAGNAFATFISALIPPENSQIFASTDIPANGNIQQLSNPLMATATGGSVNTGITGTMPASFSVFRKSGTASAVASVISDPNGYGNNIQLVCTFVANGDILQIGNNATIGNFTLPGDIVDSGCEITVASGSSNLKGVYMSTLFFNQYSNNPSDLFPLDATALPAVAMDMVIKTVPIPLSSANSAIAWQLNIEASGAGSATVTIKRPWLRRRFAS